MEDGSPSRRSWADEANEELSSPRALGAGSPGLFMEGVLGSASPSVTRSPRRCHWLGKERLSRKAQVRASAPSHPTPPRRSHPSPRPVPSPSPQRDQPATHPARALGVPDADGFYNVRSHHCDCRRSPPRSPRPVPPELRGLCFNCLANSHVKAQCTYPARCYNCWCEGHRAVDCPFPVRPARAAAIAAMKRARSPARGHDRRRVVQR